MSRDKRPAPAAPNTLGAQWQVYAEAVEAERDEGLDAMETLWTKGDTHLIGALLRKSGRL